MAVTNSSRVLFGTPEHGKGAPRQAERGRLCADAMCTTVLSTYNRSTTCYLHTVPSSKHALHRT
jgi:hypothetical protein